MRQPPCYNKETKTDCPRRTAGCAVNCPEWAEYLKERDEEYRRRAAESKVKGAVYGLESARVKEHYRKLRYRTQRGKIGFK